MNVNVKYVEIRISTSRKIMHNNFKIIASIYYIFNEIEEKLK